MCTQLVRAKAERGKAQEAGPADLAAIEADVEAVNYTTLTKFDADVTTLISAVLRENGRASTLGNAAVQLKKVILESKKKNSYFNQCP